jgi:hypothetical protein
MVEGKRDKSPGGQSLSFARIAWIASLVIMAAFVVAAARVLLSYEMSTALPGLALLILSYSVVLALTLRVLTGKVKLERSVIATACLHVLIVLSIATITWLAYRFMCCYTF